MKYLLVHGGVINEGERFMDKIIRPKMFVFANRVVKEVIEIANEETLIVEYLKNGRCATDAAEQGPFKGFPYVIVDYILADFLDY